MKIAKLTPEQEEDLMSERQPERWTNAQIDRWFLAQQRDRWIYNLVAGAVLCLLAFVVAGGCR